MQLMQDSDRKRFRDLMERAGAVYCEDVSHRFAPYWELLAKRLDIEAFATALERHALDPERGRFFPRPADLMAAAPSDGRPSGDEAWALALLARDEADTVCWTEEIAAATAAAWPVLDVGDKVGARMAFLAAYQRVVSRAREDGQPVRWRMSLGHDPQRRADACEAALRQGLVRLEEVEHLLPAPPATGPVAEIAGLLAGKVMAHPAREEGRIRQHLAALREAIRTPAQAQEPVETAGLSERDQAVLGELRERPVVAPPERDGRAGRRRA